MSDKREIFRRNGKYEHCDIVYWPEMAKPDYIIARDDRGHEMVCHYAMGIWCEMDAINIIGRLRFHDRNVIETRRHYTQPPTLVEEQMEKGIKK